MSKSGYTGAPLLPSTATVDGAPIAPVCDACGGSFRPSDMVRAADYVCRTVGHKGTVPAMHPKCWRLSYGAVS
jgi:hypothetical protein